MNKNKNYFVAVIVGGCGTRVNVFNNIKRDKQRCLRRGGVRYLPV